jgi:hypothetical protein
MLSYRVKVTTALLTKEFYRLDRKTFMKYILILALVYVSCTPQRYCQPPKGSRDYANIPQRFFVCDQGHTHKTYTTYTHNGTRVIRFSKDTILLTAKDTIR